MNFLYRILLYYLNAKYHGKCLMRTNLLGLLSLRELRRRGRPAHDHQGWQIANYSGHTPNFTEKYMERFVILRKSWLKITDGTFAGVECHYND